MRQELDNNAETFFAYLEARREAENEFESVLTNRGRAIQEERRQAAWERRKYKILPYDVGLTIGNDLTDLRWRIRPKVEKQMIDVSWVSGKTGEVKRDTINFVAAKYDDTLNDYTHIIATTFEKNIAVVNRVEALVAYRQAALAQGKHPYHVAYIILCEECSIPIYQHALAVTPLFTQWQETKQEAYFCVWSLAKGKAIVTPQNFPDLLKRSHEKRPKTTT